MQQKKLILKTAIASLLVICVLLLALFGILSYCAPVTMMKLSSSLGLDSMSGDYAYEAYGRSGDVEYLARAFEIAAESGHDVKASERFDTLYEHEDFAKYCASVDEQFKASEDRGAVYGYRAYVCGQAARVKYRLALEDTEKAEVAAFALSETEEGFPAGNPLLALALEAASAGDASFCSFLLETLRAGGFPEENGAYINIVNILEKVAKE